jgi:uncharacterized membrane protein YidH (DUF202 family)
LLAWYRTAFGAYALAVALGGVVPAVAPKASEAYRVIGVIFAALGAIAALIGIWHYVVFQEDAGPGRPPRISTRSLIPCISTGPDDAHLRVGTALTDDDPRRRL